MNMIGEFGWMDDWDLQAVVRGCSTSDYVNVSSYEAMDCLALPSFIAEPDDDILWNLSDLLETSRVVDDLEELYKPFYPQGTSIASSPVVEAANSPPSPEGTGNDCLEKAGVDGWPVPEPVKDSGIHQGANKYRRRKNLQKKEVQHVKADDVSSDVWAWRKYGQKPIKGSPYPRSYYRCSSSKGCSARKQVERSNSDPDIFIVTYTGDHCHSHPTRRNALAGSTRTKFSKQPNNNITSQCNNGAIVKVLKDHVGAACESEDSPSSSSSITLSPSTTPLLSADKTSHETTTRIDESIMGLGQHVSDDFSSIIFGDGLFMEYEEMNAMMGMDMPVTNDSFDGKEEFYKYGDY